MGITRSGPVKNFDTDEIIRVDTPTNMLITRSKISRLLKKHGVPHKPGWPKDNLINLMHLNNIQYEVVPPGRIGEEKTAKVVELHPSEKDDDNYPKNFGKLKALCKEKSIPFKRDAKRVDLVRKLQMHEELYG